MKSEIQSVLDDAVHIIVGDANGADKAIQAYLSDVNYKTVTVFHVGETSRNNVGLWDAQQVPAASNLKGRAFYTEKDKVMALKADYGIVFWDGKSAGSISNVCELLSLKKTAFVYSEPLKKFIKVTSAKELTDLLSVCAPNVRDALEKSSILKLQLETLKVSKQHSLGF